MSEIAFQAEAIPYVTTTQMREVDRAMIEDFKIDLMQMMENAGRNLAHLARSRFFGGDPQNKRVVVLVGHGGNGGGVLVAARRLHNWGAAITVVLSQPESMTGVPGHQLAILKQMGVQIGNAAIVSNVAADHLILDGLIGYSLNGPPFGQVADLIRWANGQSTSVLSLDVPSGVNADTGAASDPAVRATATMTLALPKRGLRAPGAAVCVGELYLADIGVPPELYVRPPLAVRVGPLFAREDVIRL